MDAKMMSAITHAITRMTYSFMDKPIRALACGADGKPQA
jgi:hypothetical protein